MVELSSAELFAWQPELDTPVWDRFPEATAANAQEVYPGVGDPLSFDLNLMAIDNGQRGFTRKIGLAGVMGLNAWPRVAYFPAYYGHVFINISATRELVKWLPRGDPDAIDEQLFGATRPAGAPWFKPTLQQRLVRHPHAVQADSDVARAAKGAGGELPPGREPHAVVLPPPTLP